VNRLVAAQGGLAAVGGGEETVLPLPVAGLMSGEGGLWTAERYLRLNRHARAMGSTLQAPFMTLSFMSLLVIPSLKISDRGLFDARTFEPKPLYLDP
jgi:adenine deaminase